VKYVDGLEVVAQFLVAHLHEKANLDALTIPSAKKRFSINASRMMGFAISAHLIQVPLGKSENRTRPVATKPFSLGDNYPLNPLNITPCAPKAYFATHRTGLHVPFFGDQRNPRRGKVAKK
jgi:hypothetical protein